MDEDYPALSSLAAIGDGHSLAVLGKDGGVEWYCPLRFDAMPVFWRLLDRREGGTMRISPAEPCSTRMAYLRDTAVLEYAWETARGRARAQVCMTFPGEGRFQQIVWRIEGLSGELDLSVTCRPKPGFGRTRTVCDGFPHGFSLQAEGCFLKLASTVPLRSSEAGVDERVTVKAGQTLAFRLSATRHHHAVGPLDVEDASRAIAVATRYWEDWVAEIGWEGSFREEVIRSAIALKMLIYEPTGAIVAAGTTSLPEAIGEGRNWDYRFTWLRDASLTVDALYGLGLRREGRRWAQWIGDTVRNRLPLRIFYTVTGESDLQPREIPGVDGYRGSRPVRVGNWAEEQLQMDIYGELLDSVSMLEIMGNPSMRDEWGLFRRLADAVCEKWHHPGNGIWEVPGTPRHYVYSKAMAWVALERALRLSSHFDLPGDAARWTRCAERIRAELFDKGVDRASGSFVRSYGETEVDASLLRLGLVGFVEPTDPRMLATLDRVLAELRPKDALDPSMVYRYRPGNDGLAGEEGAFMVCSFWAVEALAVAGRVPEAERLFEQALALKGELGLFAEEVDVRTGAQLGNFPQAFTHIGVINAAHRLLGRRTTGEAVGHSGVESATRNVGASTRAPTQR